MPAALHEAGEHPTGELEDVHLAALALQGHAPQRLELQELAAGLVRGLVHEHRALRGAAHEARGQVHDVPEDGVLPALRGAHDAAPAGARGHARAALHALLVERVAEAHGRQHRPYGVVREVVHRRQPEHGKEHHALVVDVKLIYAAFQRVDRALEEPHDKLRAASVRAANRRAQAPHGEEDHGNAPHLGILARLEVPPHGLGDVALHQLRVQLRQPRPAVLHRGPAKVRRRARGHGQQPRVARRGALGLHGAELEARDALRSQQRRDRGAQDGLARLG
mmetsp:Transcript_15437/g.48680  ORF Transcript_15437/g.48680 Transcript_15437/m.48680 type:complete len:279 (-) Transcript_15437:267-1103(-)